MHCLPPGIRVEAARPLEACTVVLRRLPAVAAGPAHPYQKDGIAAGLKNHRAGHVEDTHLHSFAFDEQYNTYHR